MPETILEQFERTVRAHAARPAMARKVAGAWRPHDLGRVS